MPSNCAGIGVDQCAGEPEDVFNASKGVAPGTGLILKKLKLHNVETKRSD